MRLFIENTKETRKKWTESDEGTKGEGEEPRKTNAILRLSEAARRGEHGTLQKQKQLVRSEQLTSGQ